MRAKLIFPLDGTMRCIYNKDIPIGEIGEVDTNRTMRVSDVELGPDGKWYADLGRIGGPILGPFDFECRDDAIAAEVDWLNKFYLPSL